MLKTTPTLAAVSLALLLSSSVSAANLEYLGPHTTDPGVDGVNGGQGVFVYNELCAAAFDGGQMCDTLDLLRSGSSPKTELSVIQWVKPVMLSVPPENPVRCRNRGFSDRDWIPSLACTRPPFFSSFQHSATASVGAQRSSLS